MPGSSAYLAGRHNGSVVFNPRSRGFGHLSAPAPATSGCCYFPTPCRLVCRKHPSLEPLSAQSGRDIAASAPSHVPGSVRRVRISRNSPALEVLRRVARQAVVPTAPVEPDSLVDAVTLRFPTLEFRSLLLNTIGRESFPDRAVWKRHKVEICALLLHLSAGDVAAYQAGLHDLVTSYIRDGGAPTPSQGDRHSALAGGADPHGAAACSGTDSEDEGAAASEQHGARFEAPPASRSTTLSPAAPPSLARHGCTDSAPMAAVTAAATGSGSTDTASAPDAPRPRKRTLESRRQGLRAQADAWCRAVALPPPAPAAPPPLACAPPPAGLPPLRSEPSGKAWRAVKPALAAAAAAFRLLRPLLEAVLGAGEPAPQAETRRNGSETEEEVASLMCAAMPAGWRLLCGATILRVDGVPFPNRKHCKGEADLLLVDPDGVVQALVEVKTAKGNPYLALYEDVDKLTALLRATRNRSVTVRHGAGPAAETETLPFARRLHPIYVLGCSGAALGLAEQGGGEGQAEEGEEVVGRTLEAAVAAARGGAAAAAAASAGAAAGTATFPAAAAPCTAPATIPASQAVLPSAAPAAGSSMSQAVLPSPSSMPTPPNTSTGQAVLRSAWFKLLTMELGRELASGVGAWAGVSLEAASREAVVLRLPAAAYPPLAARVAAYFTRLGHCDVYLIQP